MTAGVRCGRIGYTNVLPIYAAFDAGKAVLPGRLTSAAPTTLNTMLIRDELDCSPVSSFFYAQHCASLTLMRGLCVGSQSAVASVLCISPTPIEHLADREVSVTSESASGRALFEVLCRLRYGFAPRLRTVEGPLTDGNQPRILIGDAAVAAAERSPAADVHDLGSLWRESTGYPMVYAVWAARLQFARRQPQELEAVNAALLESLAWGVANIDQEVIPRAEAAVPRPAGFYADYYRKLFFRLDDTALCGLREFYRLAAAYSLLDREPEISFHDEVFARG